MKEKAKQQLQRLVSQLNDIEASKDDLDLEEYLEAKRDTLGQLEEFRASLDKMELKLETILDPFQTTSDIIKLFMRKTSDGLRQKLEEIERDFVTGKVRREDFDAVKLEVLQELLKLDTNLITAEEKAFLSASMNNAGNLESLDENNSKVSTDQVLHLLK